MGLTLRYCYFFGGRLCFERFEHLCKLWFVIKIFLYLFLDTDRVRAELRCTVTGTFVPTYFRSRERKFHRWNFRSMELSFPGTFAPLCPKIVLVTNCKHGEPGSQDPCTRPVEACRPKRLMRPPPHMQDINTCTSACTIGTLIDHISITH